MNGRSKRFTYAVIAIIVCLVVVIAPVIAINFLLQSQKDRDIYTNGRFSGVSTTFKSTQSVDSSLSRYVNLTSYIVTGQGGQGYSWTTDFTNLTWIGSPQDSIIALQNIHLAVYSRLDENDSFSEGSGMLTIGLHAVANQTEPTIPDDAIDYKEAIIPSLGVYMPSYSYTFNCSTYIS